MRAALAEFTVGLEAWPTYEQLRAAGRPDLAHAISVNGGPERWARELGMTVDSRVTRALRWTPDRVDRELRAFVAGRETYPSRTEFRDAGRYELFKAVCRHGGIAYWRARMGLPTTRTPWTDDDLDAAVREVVGDRPDWPSEHGFAEAGALHLVRAMRRRGGVATWADRLGKTVSPQQRSRLNDPTG